MKRYLMAAALFVSLLHGGIFDFLTIKEAKDAYADGRYKEAAALYRKLAEEGSDEAKFNAADALYKAGDYAGALKLYEEISSPELAFKKYHNLGNTYAALDKVDEAIAAYKKALQIREDSDTRYNLKLLEELKRQKERKEKKSQNSAQKESRSQSGQSEKDSANRQNEKEGKEGEQESRQERQSQEQSDKRREDGDEKERAEDERKESAGEKEINGSEEMGRQMMQKPTKEEPISDMELRKWNEELNRRGIHTLMLPLPTKKSEGGEREIGEW